MKGCFSAEQKLSFAFTKLVRFHTALLGGVAQNSQPKGMGAKEDLSQHCALPILDCSGTG